MSKVIIHLGQATASESSRWGGSPGPLVVTALVRSDWAATLQVLLARQAHAALWSRPSGPRRIEGRESARRGPLLQNQACHRPRATPTDMSSHQTVPHDKALEICHLSSSLDNSGCALQPLHPLGRSPPRPSRLGARAAGSFDVLIPDADCRHASPTGHVDGASAGSVCLILRGCPHCRRQSRVRFAGDAPPLTAAGNAAPAPRAARTCFAAPKQVGGPRKKMTFRRRLADLPKRGWM